MEFEEMQVIWDSQNNEKLYAINEATLFKNIQSKGNSVNNYVRFVEILMIIVNFGVGIWLLADGYFDDYSVGLIVIAVLYLIFSAYSTFLWFNRRQDEKQFDQTMLGELDKAIWRSNYLIRLGRDMIVWYLLPIVVVSILFVWIEGGSWQTAGFLILLLPASYYAGRWEIRKIHAPKKRDLQALRETLLANETEQN